MHHGNLVVADINRTDIGQCLYTIDRREVSGYERISGIGDADGDFIAGVYRFDILPLADAAGTGASVAFHLAVLLQTDTVVFTCRNHHDVFPVFNLACILGAGTDNRAVFLQTHCPVGAGGYLNQSVRLKGRNILSGSHKLSFFRNIHGIGGAKRKPVCIGQFHFCGAAHTTDQVDCADDQGKSCNTARNRQHRPFVQLFKNCAEVKSGTAGFLLCGFMRRFGRNIFFRFLFLIFLFFCRIIRDLIHGCFLEDDRIIREVPFRFGRYDGLCDEVVREIFGFFFRSRCSHDALQGIGCFRPGKRNLNTVIIFIQTRQCHRSGIVRKILDGYAVKMRKLKQLINPADRVAVFPVHIFRNRHDQFFSHVTLRISKVLSKRCKFFGKSIRHTENTPMVIFYYGYRFLQRFARPAQPYLPHSHI